jgi:hypothetical protein
LLQSATCAKNEAQVRPDHSRRGCIPRTAPVACDSARQAGGILMLRFLHFYPSQLKQLAIGRRIRAFGTLAAACRHGMHPRVKVVRR